MHKQLCLLQQDKASAQAGAFVLVRLIANQLAGSHFLYTLLAFYFRHLTYFCLQMNLGIIRFFILIIILFCGACANITAPTGGKKDLKPPILLSIDPPDSQTNAHPKRIELDFNKYITVSDAAKEMQLSPIIAIQPTIRAINRSVVVKIADTLLEDSTTYRLSFGNSIKDVHEGNIFAKYVYTFSTTSYFDSLTLSGRVINASTGLPDTGRVLVELYNAKSNDSAVVRRKPKYVIKADATGKFEFKGLPHRSFRLYALKDANDNLIYDGIGEMIAFNEGLVLPGDTLQPLINLRLFAEDIDTSTKKKTDTSSAVNKNAFGRKKQVAPPASYSLNLDTSNVNKRTFDINGFIKLSFNKEPVFNREKIKLTYDSLGVEIPAPIAIIKDTLHPTEFHIILLDDSLERKELHADGLSWKENTVYTLKLQKGFGKDTSGVDFSPSKFIFRTRESDVDYGNVTVHMPSKYYSAPEEEQPGPHKRNGAGRDTIPDYVLMVVTDKDTVYTKKITDTMVRLTRLTPGSYRFRVIVDKNKDGKWNTGDLFGKKQPEDVVPYPEPLAVKADWDETLDFEQKPPPPKVVPLKPVPDTPALK